MLNVIFKNGNRTVNSKIVKTSPMLTRLSSDFTRDIGVIMCPNHKSESSATILIDAVSTSRDWQIINSCCPDYKQALEFGISYPLGQGKKRPVT